MAEEFVTKEEYVKLVRFTQELAGYSIEIARTVGCSYQKNKIAIINEQLEKILDQKKYKKYK